MSVVSVVRLLVILISVEIFQSSAAQDWRLYFLPRTYAGIEAPAQFRRVRYYEGEHGIGDSWTTKAEARGGVVYVAQESKPLPRDYAILVIDIPKAKRPVSQDTLDYLKWWIGGDDDSEPTSTTEIEAHGIKGKEYLYARDIALNRYTRGRIFNAGKRVYILIFKSSKPEDLNSKSALRFLNSFRLENQK